MIVVVILAAGMRLGAAPEVFSAALGIASGAGLLAALIFFSARRYGSGDPFVWIAPFLLAGHRSYTAWSTGGLETMFFTLLVFCAYARLLEERRSERERRVGSSLLFAAAALTRPEGMLFAALGGALYVWDVFRGRRSLFGAAASGCVVHRRLQGNDTLAPDTIRHKRFLYRGSGCPSGQPHRPAHPLRKTRFASTHAIWYQAP